MSIRYRTFQTSDFPYLYQAFIDSFSDYFVHFAPPEDQFRVRIFDKLNVFHGVSALCWKNDQVVSFILHTVNDYNGIRTAYNGGTGTIISERQKGHAARTYEYLLPGLQESAAQRILLEVIEKNTKGQKLYESLGFQFTRVVKCFSLSSRIEERPISNLNIQKHETWKPSYANHLTFEPSFIDSSAQLPYNLKNETILEAQLEEEVVGHITYQQTTGRISQVAVIPHHRKKGIGRELIRACQHYSGLQQVTVMNIPEYENDTIDALEAIGFKNELNQFELELII